MTDRVWLHATEYDRDKQLSPLIPVHEPIDPDMDYEVPATSDMVVRWESAIREAERAVAEMRALHDAADAAHLAAEHAVEQAEDALYEEDRVVDATFATIAEAELELRDGPREWVCVTREQERSGWHNRGSYVVGETWHHVSCKMVDRVRWPSSVGDPVRFPEAVRMLERPVDSFGFRIAYKRRACKVCARRLVAQPEGATS